MYDRGKDCVYLLLSASTAFIILLLSRGQGTKVSIYKPLPQFSDHDSCGTMVMSSIHLSTVDYSHHRRKTHKTKETKIKNPE